MNHRLTGRRRYNLLRYLYEKHKGECYFCDAPTMLVRDADGHIVDEAAGYIYINDLAVAIATTEHLVPLRQGGSNDLENVVLSCYQCNRRRSQDRRHSVDILWLYWINDGEYYGTIVAPDAETFKNKLEKLCSREGVKINALGFREVKNMNKSIFQRVDHKADRVKFINEKLIGELVEVKKMGDADPQREKDIHKYVPLPEYGVCLIQR